MLWKPFWFLVDVICELRTENGTVSVASLLFGGIEEECC